MLVGLGLMLLFPPAGMVHKHLFTVTLVVHSVELGLFIPTVNPMMLSRFSTNVGFASGTLGFLLLFGGAFGAVVVSVLQDMLPILTLPATMLLLAVAAAVVMALLRIGADGSSDLDD